MTYCGECGSSVRSGTRFCTNCGTRLEQDVPGASSPAPAAPSQPALPVAPPPRKFPILKVLGITGGALATLVILVAVMATLTGRHPPKRKTTASGSVRHQAHTVQTGTRTHATPTESSSQVAAASTAPEGLQSPSATLLDKTGSGAWTSPTFGPSGDWHITYSFDCSSQRGAGNFIVTVYGPGNQFTTDGVNELKTSGSGTTYVRDVTGQGTYLEVNSECTWHVQAVGPGTSAASSSTGSTGNAATLLDHQGRGQWTSPAFAPKPNWQINYSYDCSTIGSPGNFIVSVYRPGNILTADSVNELKERGSGTTYVHDVTGAGTHLVIGSECNWHVTARQ